MLRNILLLLDGLPAGGLERQIVELLRGMRERRQYKMLLGVLVKGGEREKEAQQYADFVVPIRQQASLDLTLAFSLVRHIAQYKIDCLHSFGSIADISAVFAGKAKRIPIINGSIRSAPPKLYGRYKVCRWCMPFATWIVANSSAGLKAFGVENLRNTSVIYNGIGMERFRDVAGQPRGDGLELCMVANFSVKKDQEALIRCLPSIHSHYPGARLTLVGRGERKQTQLEQLIQSLRLSKAIELVTRTDHPESYIKRSDICFLLTNSSIHGEGIANAIMEYMALAKPVIATDCGGNGELIENGRTGIIVSDHKPETIVNAVDSLMSNREGARKMGEYGKIRLQREFSLARMVEEYEKLYTKILGKNSSNGSFDTTY
jgi:glycosyltransferase involved in cell wall biosynthesis